MSTAAHLVRVAPICTEADLSRAQPNPVGITYTIVVSISATRLTVRIESFPSGDSP